MQATRRDFFLALFALPLCWLLGIQRKPDLWAIIDRLSKRHNKRTGLTEQVYGKNEVGTNCRTAEEVVQQSPLLRGEMIWIDEDSQCSPEALAEWKATSVGPCRIMRCLHDGRVIHGYLYA